MSITLKVILLVLGIITFVGCIFWWSKENSWQSKFATMTTLSTLIVLAFNLSQNKIGPAPHDINGTKNKADTIVSASTTGDKSPAVISNGGEVKINYDKTIEKDTINK